MAQSKLLIREGSPIDAWQPAAIALEGQADERLVVARVRVRLPRRSWARKDVQVAPDNVRARDLLQPDRVFAGLWHKPLYRVRKNQHDLSATEWARYIQAIEAIAAPNAAAPTYHDFVDIHDRAMMTMAGMAWGAHSMGMSDGRNFLTWHREYLAKLEARLRIFNPLVTIPYWNWVEDRAIPVALTNVADLVAWGITRGPTFNGALLPSATTINGILAAGVTPPDFRAFSSALEQPHNTVHGLVGGTFGTSRSPADPLFWLHHSFIDKLWADWEALHPAASFNPLNVGETLKPVPIMTRTVRQVRRIRRLGYVYG
jgi:tyrosinase